MERQHLTGRMLINRAIQTKKGKNVFWMYGMIVPLDTSWLLCKTRVQSLEC